MSIVPKKIKDSDSDASITPLSVTGTAEDLGAELSTTIITFVGSHLQMKNTLEKAKAEMDAASKAAQAEARAKAKTPAKTASPNTEVTQYAPTAKPAEPAKPAPQKPASLFVADCNRKWPGLQWTRFQDRINCDYRRATTGLSATETAIHRSGLQSISPGPN